MLYMKYMFYYILYIKRLKNNISIELTLKKLPYISTQNIPETSALSPWMALPGENEVFKSSSSLLRYYMCVCMCACLILCDPMDCSLPGSSLHGMFQTELGCHFFLQGIFPTRGSNASLLCLLYWQAGSLPAESLGKHAYSKRQYSLAVHDFTTISSRTGLLLKYW